MTIECMNGRFRIDSRGQITDTRTGLSAGGVTSELASLIVGHGLAHRRTDHLPDLPEPHRDGQNPVYPASDHRFGTGARRRRSPRRPDL